MSLHVDSFLKYKNKKTTRTYNSLETLTHLTDLSVNFLFGLGVGAWGLVIFSTEVDGLQKESCKQLKPVLWLLFVNSLFDILTAFLALMEMFVALYESLKRKRQNARTKRRFQTGSGTQICQLFRIFLMVPSAFIVIYCSLTLWFNECKLHDALYHRINYYLAFYWTFTFLQLLIFSWIWGLLGLFGLTCCNVKRKPKLNSTGPIPSKHMTFHHLRSRHHDDRMGSNRSFHYQSLADESSPHYMTFRR